MKLIQFTDFHLRLTPAPQTQFHMQPFWRGTSRELFSRVANASKDADAICFTGDAVHGGGADEIAMFFNLLASAVNGKPVFLVAGNHDVVDPRWQEFFQRGIGPHSNITFRDGICSLGELDIVLVNNHYLQRDGTSCNSWQEGFFPVPVLAEPEASRLDRDLSQGTERPAIVLTHCPTHALPATLADYAPGVVTKMDQYRDTFHAVLDQHPRARLVLSGHVHLNTTKIYNQSRVHMSLASVSEYPHQARVIEINGGEMTTHLIALSGESDPEETVDCVRTVGL